MARRRVSHVEMRQWRPGRLGNKLVTDGVDACVAIALSNPAAERGYLGHFSPDDRVAIRTMLEHARRAASHPRDVLLWYGGAAPVPSSDRDSKELNEENRSFRVAVTQLLSSTGFSVRQVLWLPPLKWLSVELDCGTSVCRMKTEDARI